MTIFINFRRVFRTYSTYTTCRSWYLITHFSDTLVMVINCQKRSATVKNGVLGLNLICSRSVLVLNIENFSCSCSVLVWEQEHVREHVPEQYACSFIPCADTGYLKNYGVHMNIYTVWDRWPIVAWRSSSCVSMRFERIWTALNLFRPIYFKLDHVWHSLTHISRTSLLCQIKGQNQWETSTKILNNLLITNCQPTLYVYVWQNIFSPIYFLWSLI